MNNGFESLDFDWFESDVSHTTSSHVYADCWCTQQFLEANGLVEKNAYQQLNFMRYDHIALVVHRIN